MRIDLHTHSRASDGTQTPTELVRAAKAAGLDVVALTDHDTSAGWDEATAAAYDVGITLVKGMEISARIVAGPRGDPRSCHPHPVLWPCPLDRFRPSYRVAD